jgi:tetratricopeptide (TPR) repeat protein
VKIPNRLAFCFDRLVGWAESAARIWADWWLLIIGSLLVFGSAILKWVQFPFSHNVRGINFSFLHDPGLAPHFSPFSIGAIGAVLLATGLIFWRRSPTFLGLVAAVLVMLWTITPAEIAFRQPSMLRRLTYELEVTPVLNVFSKQYLLQNYGSPELVPKRLVLYSAWGRFVAAWSFLRLGWYCFGLGALLIGLYAVGRFPTDRWATAGLFLCLPLGGLLILLVPSALGQHYFSNGLLAKTEGRNQEAINDFRKAMRWDAWHSHDIDLYATIGELQKQGGIGFNSPERHVSRAIGFRQASNYEPAIFEFNQAAETGGGALAETAMREAATTRVTYGLALYQAGGIGGAVTNWELALSEDPSQIYALPYLARGYYDLGRYKAGIETAQRLSSLVKDHSFVVANAYSTVGDCYAKLGDDAAARRYYTLSLAVDPILNYWAVTGLAGE